MNVAVHCKWNFPILHQPDYLSPGTLVCTTFIPPPPQIPLQTSLRSLVTTGNVILTETSLYLKWLLLNICPSRKLRFKFMFFCDGKCAISCTLVKPKRIVLRNLYKFDFFKGLTYFLFFPRPYKELIYRPREWTHWVYYRYWYKEVGRVGLESTKFLMTQARRRSSNQPSNDLAQINWYINTNQ